MKSAFLLVYKILRRARKIIWNRFSRIYCKFIFWIYDVNIARGFKTNGLPKFFIRSNTKIIIGKNFRINNGNDSNPIGRQQRCLFVVGHAAKLIIGNNVGMSSTTLAAHKSIVIGDNVKIGGNTVIYDTDFHSLNIEDRIAEKEILQSVNIKAVEVCNGVFIGAHTTILKGVKVGENSIIGACSVVTKSIPANQIWAGNPARFIKNI